MWRFLAGVGSALLLVTAGLFMWRAQADGSDPVPPMPAMTAAVSQAGETVLAPPPAADERTKEEKRFARYDKDKNGTVAQAEYLVGRKRGFDKLDVNRDGRLSFEEYATKGVQKYAAADKDRNGALNAAEFATTRVIRKARPRQACPPERANAEEES